MAGTRVSEQLRSARLAAVLVLGALAAATIAIVVVVRDKENPKLETGTPTRVAP